MNVRMPRSYARRTTLTKRSSLRGSPKCMKRPPLQVPYAVRVRSIVMARASQAEPLQFILQLSLKSLQIGCRGAITLLLRDKSQTSKLVQMPFGIFAVAECYFAAHQRDRASHAIHAHRHTAQSRSR